MNKKRGFTLVELLVVIAIIALLMSILMPALARVRVQAKVVICQSNLRQWGAIFSMYTADNNSSFQEGWDTVGTSNWWMDSTKPYYSAGVANEMGGSEIFFCPAAANRDKKVADGHVNFGIWDDRWLDNKGYEGSYGINGWVENKVKDREYPEMAPKRWRTDRVSGAAQVPLFMDAPWIDAWPEHFDEPPDLDNVDWRWQPESHMSRFCKDRHNGYIDILFLDYTVRKIGLKEMWLLKWNRSTELDGEWTTEGGVDPGDWPDWMQGFKNY